MRHTLLFVIILFVGVNAFTQDVIQIPEVNDSTMIVISDMVTKGNSKVNDKVIFGESRLKEGQQIPIKQFREELLKSRQNLLNTRLFNAVEVLIYKWTDQNLVSIEFVVDERWYIYPFPILELSGISFQEWKEEFDQDIDRLTYGLEMTHHNLTGNGDRLDVEWNDGFQHRYKLDYTTLGIDKNRNWGISAGVDHLRTRGTVISAEDNQFNSVLFDDFVFKRQSANFSVIRRRQINRRHGLTVSYSSIDIGQEILDLSPNYFPDGIQDFEYLSLGYFGFLENRNLSEYATNGEFIAGNIVYSGVFEDHLEQLQIGGTAKVYRPINEKFYASAGLHARVSPIYEESFFTLRNNRLNILQNPRGYNDYQLFPSDFATLKSELRYQLLDTQFDNVPILPKRFEPMPLRIYPKLFFDTSRTFPASNDVNNPLNDDFLYSYGAGLDVVSLYNIPLRFEIARNHLGETGFNFAIGNSF